MAGGLLDNIGGTTIVDPTTIGQDAQDTAKAQGVAYEDIAKTSEEAAPIDYKDYDAAKVGSQLEANVSFKPSESYIDKATSTVAGQLNTLLDSESPYIKQQERQAEEQAAGRGLLNTSIATQKGREAAIQSALPIAQQDAQTYAGFAQKQQQAEYQTETIQSEAIVSGEMVEQKARIDRKNQDINNAFSARVSGANEQSKAWLGDLQNTYNEGLQNLDVIAKQTLLETELNSQQSQNVASSAAAIMQNYQVSVENMMTDPDFLNLGAAAVNNAINQLQNLAANSINFISKSQGIDMSIFIDTYLEDLEVM
jgi:hypothetical protein